MNENYSFIKYTKNNFTNSEDFIGLLRSGIVSLSKSFLLKNNFSPEEHRFVVFFYDEKKNAIGLQFTKEKVDDFFTVVYDKRGHGGASISCGTFFKAFKIDTKIYARRYPYEIVDDPNEGKIYVINLKHDD